MKIRPIFKTIDIFSFIQFLSRQTNYIIKFFLLKVLYLVLFVFKLYCRIFPKKLCDDLVWIYSCFSIIGFCLLVCKGEKQTGIYTISTDFGSIVQYVLCIWMLVF